MKGKLAGILICVLYVLSLFAGVAANEIHAINVIPFNEASTPAADSITVTGTESHTWTFDSSKDHAFYVPHGTYEVTAKKAGYTDFVYSNIVIDDSEGKDSVATVYYQFIAQPSQNEGTDSGSQSDGTQVQSNTVAVTDVDFEDEVKANEALTFDVDVKNNGKYDAENVQVTVTILNIDDGEDLDQTEEFSTLDVNEKDTYTVGLTVPKEVDAKKYSFEVKVEWEDADGSEYYTAKTYTDAIEVTKEKHDVQVTGASFLASSIEAGKSNQASVSLWNAGKNDETVRIKIEVPDLKISAMSAQFKLNENDESTQYISFTVPADAKAGKYFAYATVYFNSGVASNMEMLTLDIKAPAVQTSDSKVTVTPVVVTTQTEQETSGKGIAASIWLVGAIIGLLVLAMLAKEFAPHFAPKPVVIKAGRGGR